MWFTDNWRKAILRDIPPMAEDLIQKGVELSDADEELLKEKYPWRILESLISSNNKEWFDYFIKLTPSKASIRVIDVENYKPISIGSSGYYDNFIDIEVSKFAYCFKTAIDTGNTYVFNYAKSKVNKDEITNPIIWGMEVTMINHLLHCGKKAGKYGKEILLSIINYDPQVNIPVHKEYPAYTMYHNHRTMMFLYEFPLHKVLRLDTANYNYHDGFINPDDGDEGDIEILKALIDNGANPNIQDSKGFTALHYCSYKNEIEYLLSVGANPDIKNSHGNTARESQELLKSIQPFNIPGPFDEIY